MDPMDFVLHQHHPRPAGHYDPVHAASSPWAPHPQASPAYQWQPHPSGLPQPYPHPLQQVPGDPFFFAQNGGLPPPIAGFYGAPAADSFPGMSNRRVSHGSHRQSWRSHARPAQPSFGGHPGSNGQENDGSFVNQTPGNRSANFQPAAAPGATAQAPSTPSDLNSPSRSHFAASDGAGLFVSQLNSSHVPGPAPPPSVSFPNNLSRPSYRSLSSSSTRLASTDTPTPPGHSASPPGLRRASRARRTMSASARSFPTGSNRSIYREIQELLTLRYQGRSMDGLEDEITRNLQLLQGVPSSQKGASKATLKSLLKVEISELPEDEKCCSICYNDFGVESPEKYTEVPVRLPKCKHIFGDHCIKQWLLESHHCPYCRDELAPNETQPVAVTARAFLNTLRAETLQDNRQHQGSITPAWRPEETNLDDRNANSREDLSTRRTATVQTGEGRSLENREDHAVEEDGWEEFLQQAPDESLRRAANERRSPPVDSNGQERRTRPRHNHTTSPASGVPSTSSYSHTNGMYTRPTNLVAASVPDSSPRVTMPPMPRGSHWTHTSAPRPEYTMAANNPVHLAPVVLPQGWRPPFDIRNSSSVDHTMSRAQILPNPLQTSRAAWERHNRENIPPARSGGLLQDSVRNDNGSTSPAILNGHNNPHFNNSA